MIVSPDFTASPIFAPITTITLQDQSVISLKKKPEESISQSNFLDAPATLALRGKSFFMLIAIHVVRWQLLLNYSAE